MSNATDRFIEKWEQNIALGRKKYALKQGSIWGLFVGIISSLFHYYSAGKGVEFSISELIIKIVIFVLTGFVLYYFFLWKTYNNQYNRLKNNK